MAKIDQFLKSKDSRLKRFKKLTKGKSRKEIRNVERKLLKPIKLPTYTGATPGFKSPVHERTVQIVFENFIDLDLFCKYFKVSRFKGVNVHNVRLLVEFLNILDRGVLTYDTKAEKISFVTDQDEEVEL